MSDASSEPSTEQASRSELADLREEQEVLSARMDALMTRMDLVLEAMIGDRELGEDAVAESADVMTQLGDVRSAVSSHGDRLDRLDSAGARGQPGAARKVKIRHALARKATKGGKLSIEEAAQRESPSMDFEDVLDEFDYEISDTYATKLLSKAADGAAFWEKSATNARTGRKRLFLDIGELDSDSPYLRHVRSIAEQEANSEFAETGNSELSEGGR